ncbi:hypothetical protein N7478_000752 [Penicillium angulare]|uniref:uncharacterized protein n=1 Tax=Penicillium angulare TaxID=116970 RepID=UPI00253F8F6F|nr:uncharacterized protein N7478_000752 [Penicillium angulare]KAJ5291501.1 hypothetical protein N7478_000752 [Penicillium angulare]
MSVKITRDDESSCSGITLTSRESPLQDTSLSELDSEYVPSETSEDQRFVIDDTDKLSYYSDDVFEVADLLDNDTRMMDCIIDDSPESLESGEKVPIKTVAKRTVYQNGQVQTQYLVLWTSWEVAEELREWS